MSGALIGAIRGAASRRGGFLPSDISGLVQWLSDTGSDPAEWPDISTNGYHATQATAAFRPSIQTGILNGRQVRRFDGTNDYLVATSLPLTAISFTVFLVGKHATKPWTGNINNDLQAYLDTGISGSSGWILNTEPFVAAGRIGFAAYPSSSSVGRIGADNTYQVLCARRVQGGANSVAINGSITADGNTLNWVRNSVGLYYGAWNNAGTIRRYLNGDLAEIIIYDTALSTTDRNNVEAYLSTKYAI